MTDLHCVCPLHCLTNTRSLRVRDIHRRLKTVVNNESEMNKRQIHLAAAVTLRGSGGGYSGEIYETRSPAELRTSMIAGGEGRSRTDYPDTPLLSLVSHGIPYSRRGGA